MAVQYNKTIQPIVIRANGIDGCSVVNATQYDARSRYVRVDIRDEHGRVKINGTVQLNALKPDSTHSYTGGTIESDGTLLFGLTSQMLAVVGDVQCDISVFSSEEATESFKGDGTKTAFVSREKFASIESITVNGVKVTNYTYNVSTFTITFQTAPANNSDIIVEGSGSLLLTTPSFIVRVSESLYSEGAVQSENEFTTITVTLAHLYEIVEEAKGYAEDAEESAEDAASSAEEIEDMTVTSETVDYTQQASVTKTGGEGTPYNLHFKIPKGQPGSNIQWGNISGNIANQTDLQSSLNTKVDKVTGKGLSTNDYTDADKTKVGNAITEHQSLAAYRTSAAQDVIDAGKQATLVSGTNIKTVNGQNILGSGDLSAGLVDDVTQNGTSIVENKIAKIVLETGLGSDSNNSATVTAIRSFVNSSIEAVAAYYVTADASANAFATKAALVAGPWYYAGQQRTPTTNDYAIVIADETHDGKTARYSYQVNQWAFQYTFNMQFTQAQVDALNSGITAAKVALFEAKSTVSVSATGTATDEVKYITIDGVEKKLSEGFPSTATAGDAMVYDGTSWSKQDGYGYSSSGAITITWNGDTTGKQTDDGGTSYKLTSVVPENISKFYGGTIKIILNGVETIYAIENDQYVVELATNLYVVRDVVMIAFDTATYDSVTYSKGIHFLRTDSSTYVSYLSYGSGTVVHQINSKYIPSNPTLESAITNSGIGYISGGNTTITWDGDTTGKKVVGEWCRFDGTIIPVGSLIGSTYTIKNGSVTTQHTVDVTTDMSEDFGVPDGTILMVGDSSTSSAYIMFYEQVIFEGETYDSGLYLMYINSTQYMSSLSYSSQVSHKISSDMVDDTNHTNKFVTATEKSGWDAKSTVSVSDTGTATDEVQYITIDGVEKKLAGGGSAEGAVRYDEAQTLTTTQQTQARSNIGAGAVSVAYILEASD